MLLSLCRICRDLPTRVWAPAGFLQGVRGDVVMPDKTLHKHVLNTHTHTANVGEYTSLYEIKRVIINLHDGCGVIIKLYDGCFVIINLHDTCSVISSCTMHTEQKLAAIRVCAPHTPIAWVMPAR